MHWVTVLLCFVFLFAINAELVDEASSTDKPTPISAIDALQIQLNQILVQFCASEIDRNKTDSAVLKFGQLSNGKSSIKDLVQFYVENYEDSFDNLLVFIKRISSSELQLIAYHTLIEAAKLKQINVINLLSFENFMRKIYDEQEMNEREVEGLLGTIGNQIKELVVETDLNKLIPLINSSSNSDRIFQLIPTIVQGINLLNFTDMDRIFEFSSQLPRTHEIKLIRKVLSRMREKDEYLHVFHVICQVRLLRRTLHYGQWTTDDICSLSSLENEIPLKIKKLISDDVSWLIASPSVGNLRRWYSSQYEKTILVIGRTLDETTWYFETQSSNSVAIKNDQSEYLTLEYSFHNQSFPTLRQLHKVIDGHNNWYILSSSNFRFFVIKNKLTDELLFLDDISEPVGRRATLTSLECLDCHMSRWTLIEHRSSDSNIYSSYNCEENDDMDMDNDK